MHLKLSLQAVFESLSPMDAGIYIYIFPLVHAVQTVLNEFMWLAQFLSLCDNAAITKLSDMWN